jgi:hypothetical protein
MGVFRLLTPEITAMGRLLIPGADGIRDEVSGLSEEEIILVESWKKKLYSDTDTEYAFYMLTYDTILYGNGLTSALINKINGLPGMIPSDRAVSKINDRVCSLISIGVDTPNYKKILPLFGLVSRQQSDYKKILANQKETKLFFQKDIKEIRTLGLERYAGNHFKDSELNKHIEFLYVLYNFWYKGFESMLLAKPVVVDYLENVADKFRREFNEVLTLNFDLLLDSMHLKTGLPVQHLHGRFVEQFFNFGDLQFLYFDGGRRFEYTYLFDTNAIEKLSRLGRIHSDNTKGLPYYDLDFFFDPSKAYGNLLIYGVSFFPSGVFSKDFFEAYPEDRGVPGTLDYYLVNSLDGHILYIIQEKLTQRKIDHVTIAYYSEDDREWFEELLKATPLWKNLTLCPCHEVAFSSDLKMLLS